MLDRILSHVIAYLKTPMGGYVLRQYPDCSAYEYGRGYKSIIYNTRENRIMMGNILLFSKPLQGTPNECKTRGSKDFLFGWVNTKHDVIAYIFWRRDSGSLREKIAYLESHGYSVIGGEELV